MSGYRWPRTLHGWKALALLTVGLCPQCRKPLNCDSGIFDDGRTAWCFPCGIVPFPKGLLEALRQNAAYENRRRVSP